MTPACVALVRALEQLARRERNNGVTISRDQWTDVMHAAALLAEAEGETDEDEGHSRIVAVELVDEPGTVRRAWLVVEGE